GEGLAIIGERDAGLQRPFLKRAVPLIVKQKLFHTVVGDKNVGEAVAVVVVERDSERFPLRRRDSRFHAYVAKSSSPFIMEKHIANSAELVRTAISMKRRPAENVPADVPVQVARYEQIEAAVVIVIEESGRGRPSS